MRRIFYMAMLALRDHETRKRGIVVLLCYLQNNAFESTRDGGFSGAWKAPKLALCLPIHVAAVHSVYGSMKWTPVHAILRIAFSMFTRVRFRALYGKRPSTLIVGVPVLSHIPQSLTTDETLTSIHFRYYGRMAQEHEKYRHPTESAPLQG